ncbi:MAG: HD domain-containing protein [Faecalicoccus sp.]|nr:HD domain-containing protein [Faecalicoccus sp.]
METAQIMEKMIAISEGNIHDIDHFIRVWTYAKTIGELEGLDSHTQKIVEISAIIHDIACPLCREKYGNTNGKYQEKEGMILAKQFLTEFDLSKEDQERIVYLVGHHHTFDQIDGIDYQILIEADYIANTSENGYSQRNIENFMQRIMKTESSKRIIKSIFKRKGTI